MRINAGYRPKKAFCNDHFPITKQGSYVQFGRMDFGTYFFLSVCMGAYRETAAIIRSSSDSFPLLLIHLRLNNAIHESQQQLKGPQTRFHQNHSQRSVAVPHYWFDILYQNTRQAVSFMEENAVYLQHVCYIQWESHRSFQTRIQSYNALSTIMLII